MRHLLLVPALLVTGCCTSQPIVPVYAETTLARLELPERPTRAVRLSGAVTPSAWYVLSPDHLTQPPSVEGATATTDDPEVDDPCDNDIDVFEGLAPLMLGRIDVCLAKRVSFGYSRRSNGPPMGHLVLYLAGRERDHAKAGDVSLALSAAYGRQERSVGGGSYQTSFQRHEKDFSLILGYRLAKWALVYGGPYLLRSDFDIQHTRPNTPRQDSSGTIDATGGHLGLGLFAGRYNSWLIEFSRAKFDAGPDDNILDGWSFKYQLEFLGSPAKLRKRAPAPPSGQVGPG